MSANQTTHPGPYSALAGRSALVTGAGGGIGRAIVATMVEAGVNVVATDREQSVLDELRTACEGPGSLELVVADLTNKDVPAMLAQRATDAFGRLDILVNNAGCILRHPVADTSLQDWELMMAVNVRAAFFLSQQAATIMGKHDWGRIVNLTSQAGHTGGAADCPVYAISKGAVMTMTRSLARAFAPMGITVNAVAPGIVMTDMISGTLTQGRIDELVNQIPVKRASTAQEIADAVIFLASDRAATITGHILDINGGMVMR